MRILYVYDGDWPKGATRVAKQTRSLARGGHTVHLVSRNSRGSARRERAGWMTVHRLPYVRWSWINQLLNFPYFFNPCWMWSLWRVGRAQRVESILVADLPLALTGLWVAKLLGVPAHFDMAEVYPEFIRSQWQCDRMSWTDHLVRNPRLAEWIERYALRRFQTVVVVSDESRDRCVELGVAPERLVVVGNTPEHAEELASERPLPADLERWQGRPKVLFVGILIGDRGVALAVEAMRRVVHDVPDAVLVVVGDGPDRTHIETAIANARLGAHVTLLGWRDSAVLPAYYQHADVGLLPFRDTPHIRITLANKLFDYMAAGLSFVAVDVPPMRRVVEETGAGLLYPANDVAALAAAIVRLLRDPGARAEFGRRGRAAVQSTYCWREDEKRLLAALSPDTVRSADPVGTEQWVAPAD